MGEYDDISMKELEFEALLTQSLSVLPPEEETVWEITPWRKAMGRILWGYGLTSITLNFVCLNYILPAIGVVLMLLGFRALRRENCWFKACWVMSVVRTVWLLFHLSVNATIWTERIYANPVVQVLGCGNLALVFVLTLCLWRGLREIHIKAGFAPGGGAALAMAVWYLIICLLGFVQYSGILIAGVIVVAYILILRSLHKLSLEMEEAGYVMTPAEVKLSDRKVGWGLFALMAVGIAIGYLCFSMVGEITVRFHKKERIVLHISLIYIIRKAYVRNVKANYPIKPRSLIQQLLSWKIGASRPGENNVEIAAAIPSMVESPTDIVFK